MLVALAFTENPEMSSRRASLQLQMSDRSLRRILKELGFKAFRPRMLHGLLPGDPEKRVQFCSLLLVQIQHQPDLLDCIIWSDEASFKLNGHVNSQTAYYWATENPHRIICSQLNQPGVSV
jgi:hypothetical protein